MRHLVKRFTIAAAVMMLPTIVVAADPPTAAPQIAASTPAPATTTAVAVAKPSKIGAIDLAYIGKESELGKSLKKELTDKKEKLEAKIVAERKKLDALKDSIEAKLPTFTPKQREAKAKEFQKKVDVFQKLMRDSEESFMKVQENETNKMFLLIEKTVADYGKAHDFAIIAIKKDILYEATGNDTQDLTSVILTAVNDAWKKK